MIVKQIKSYSMYPYLHLPLLGATASLGMLGDIIIAEPNAYIAFVGKGVIEQKLNKARFTRS